METFPSVQTARIACFVFDQPIVICDNRLSYLGMYLS